MSLKRYVLFYSNYCSFSESAVRQVTKYNLRNSVAMMCIDGYSRDRLPPFVDCVPLVLDRTTQKVYRSSESVSELLSSICETSSDVASYYGQDSRFSDGFSIIDGDDDGAGNMFSSCYSSINATHEIVTLQDDGPSSKDKGDLAIDNIRAQRDNQVKSVFGSQQPGQPLQRIG
jgi:hypothetical protein